MYINFDRRFSRTASDNGLWHKRARVCSFEGLKRKKKRESDERRAGTYQLLAAVWNARVCIYRSAAQGAGGSERLSACAIRFAHVHTQARLAVTRMPDRGRRRPCVRHRGIAGSPRALELSHLYALGTRAPAARRHRGYRITLGPSTRLFYSPPRLGELGELFILPVLRQNAGQY